MPRNGFLGLWGLLPEECAQQQFLEPSLAGCLTPGCLTCSELLLLLLARSVRFASLSPSNVK